MVHVLHTTGQSVKVSQRTVRAVLPEGLTLSRMYMNGTLRHGFTLNLRSGHGTQKEHMEIARECAVAIAPIFPMIKDFVNE